MDNIVVASDHGGFKLKEDIKAYLVKKGYAVDDVGTYSEESCDYPQYAYAAAKKVSDGKASRGIIVCKSGIGNSIVANKLAGVRAALCYNMTAVKLSRMHNDSNILVLGSRFTPAAQAKRMVGTWLSTEFEGGRHIRRLQQIREIEEGLRCKKR